MKWILENYQLLLSAFLVITSLIIMLLKKKPSADEMIYILSEVFSKMPDFINEAESLGLLNGKDKKDLVISISLAYVQKRFKLTLPDSYLAILSDMIESILSTPQKHS